MPRRKENPARVDSPEGDGDVLELPEIPPQQLNGKVNPEHYRVRAAHIALVGEHQNRTGGIVKNNSTALMLNLVREAERAGLELKTLADARSEGDKIRDGADKLIENPDNIWERTDEELSLMEKAVAERIIEPARRLLEARAVSTAPRFLSEAEIRRGKSMLSRLQRVRRLRAAAKHPFPKKELGLKEKDRWIWEATHILRFMVYTSRSGTIPHIDSTLGSKVYMIGPPHVRFAVDTWIAKTGVDFHDGEMRVGEKNGGPRPKMGVILVAPPGHGKSDFAGHYLALEINKDHTIQTLYVHAVVDMAELKQTYVANLFSPETAAGRRNLSMYPAALDKSDNNKKTMRLKLADRNASPTITACGMTTARLGADSTLQIFDDMVPKSDMDQPTERARRFTDFSGTFASRQRGMGTFKLIIGTMWHQDDALAKMWKISEREDMYVCSRQPVGGPVKGKKNVFEPIWPEVMPARELSRRFEEMNRNVSLWSANYMCNPIADEARIIKRLAFYDPQSAEHEGFLSSGTFHVSVDPTATNKETSDKAGMVYAATGEVPVETVKENGDRDVAYQTRLRILETREIHANQVELADAIQRYTTTRPVYQVHIECRSGFSATRDILMNKWGIDSVPHDPANKNKEQRIKQCAGVIDASLAGLSPLLEFPGQRNADGTIGPADAFKDLYSQFLDFGYSDHDHLVDATTQLVNWLLRNGILVAGFAPSASAVPDRFRLQGDPRIHAMLDEWAKPKSSRWEEEQKDWKFINSRREVA